MTRLLRDRSEPERACAIAQGALASAEDLGMEMVAAQLRALLQEIDELP
jgi:hypothetical protein